ncbi:MAG: hypothetical protein AAF085_15555 [Planctomycetota bacterium]
MSDTKQQTEHQHATLSGRWLVAMTLSLFLLVPTIAYFSWKATQGTPQRVELDYDQREGWFMQPVKSRPLKYSKFVAAETGKEYKKTDLNIDPDVEAVLQKCAAIAKTPDFFESAELRDTLIPYAKDEANGFYPPYLLASWYQVNDNPGEHERWMRIAFGRADTAIAQKLMDDKRQPVISYALPPVAIGYDRVIEGKLNATLVLIYPRPISEDNGFVYLPVYRSAYRFADPALPLGVDPGLHPTLLTLLPQESNGSDPNWFAVPDGAVGRLDDAMPDLTELSRHQFDQVVKEIQEEFGLRQQDHNSSDSLEEVSPQE